MLESYLKEKDTILKGGVAFIGGLFFVMMPLFSASQSVEHGPEKAREIAEKAEKTQKEARAQSEGSPFRDNGSGTGPAMVWFEDVEKSDSVYYYYSRTSQTHGISESDASQEASAGSVKEAQEAIENAGSLDRPKGDDQVGNMEFSR